MWHAPGHRHEPKLLPLLSKGTVDVGALFSARAQTADYVAPADRYAVVPQAEPPASSAEVPQVLTVRTVSPKP